MSIVAEADRSASEIWEDRRSSRAIRPRSLTREVIDLCWPQIDAPSAELRDPEHHFAVKRAYELLDRLEISPSLDEQVRKFLRSISEEDSTVPSVAFGEEEDHVALYWKTGPISMEVEISSDGPDYFWARDEGGTIESFESDASAITYAAHNIALRMAHRARIVNPKWREQYLSNG